MMPPSLALLAFFILTVVLIRWSKDPAESPTLWLPVIWLFILSSRQLSQWFGVADAQSAIAASEDGNGLDRAFYLALLFVAFWILARRRINWSELFAQNSILVLFLA